MKFRIIGQNRDFDLHSFNLMEPYVTVFGERRETR